MKKIISIVIVSLLLFNINVYADVTQKAVVNGVALDSAPVNIDGRILMPLRDVFEKLEAEVIWDNVNKKITATKGEIVVQLSPNDDVATINGEQVKLDVPAKIISDSTYVPIRFVSEALGAYVFWDNNEKTARIVSEMYEVIRAVDGDTLLIDYEGVNTYVRLIGIDTPESVHPDEAKNEYAGILASDFTKSIVEGKSVELEFDVEQKDIYDRLLAYVYVDGIMLNKTLIKEGFAVVKWYPPNIKYNNEFEALAISGN